MSHIPVLPPIDPSWLAGILAEEERKDAASGPHAAAAAAAAPTLSTPQQQQQHPGVKAEPRDASSSAAARNGIAPPSVKSEPMEDAAPPPAAAARSRRSSRGRNAEARRLATSPDMKQCALADTAAADDSAAATAAAPSSRIHWGWLHPRYNEEQRDKQRNMAKLKFEHHARMELDRRMQEELDAAVWAQTLPKLLAALAHGAGEQALRDADSAGGFEPVPKSDDTQEYFAGDFPLEAIADWKVEWDPETQTVQLFHLFVWERSAPEWDYADNPCGYPSALQALDERLRGEQRPPCLKMPEFFDLGFTEEELAQMAQANTKDRDEMLVRKRKEYAEARKQSASRSAKRAKRSRRSSSKSKATSASASSAAASAPVDATGDTTASCTDSESEGTAARSRRARARAHPAAIPLFTAASTAAAASASATATAAPAAPAHASARRRPPVKREAGMSDAQWEEAKRQARLATKRRMRNKRKEREMRADEHAHEGEEEEDSNAAPSAPPSPIQVRASPRKKHRSHATSAATPSALRSRAHEHVASAPSHTSRNAWRPFPSLKYKCFRLHSMPPTEGSEDAVLSSALLFKYSHFFPRSTVEGCNDAPLSRAQLRLLNEEFPGLRTVEATLVAAGGRATRRSVRAMRSDMMFSDLTQSMGGVKKEPGTWSGEDGKGDGDGTAAGHGVEDGAAHMSEQEEDEDENDERYGGRAKSTAATRRPSRRASRAADTLEDVLLSGPAALDAHGHFLSSHSLLLRLNLLRSLVDQGYALPPAVIEWCINRMMDGPACVDVRSSEIIFEFLCSVVPVNPQWLLCSSHHVQLLASVVEWVHETLTDAVKYPRHVLGDSHGDSEANAAAAAAASSSSSSSSSSSVLSPFFEPAALALLQSDLDARTLYSAMLFKCSLFVRLMLLVCANDTSMTLELRQRMEAEEEQEQERQEAAVRADKEAEERANAASDTAVVDMEICEQGRDGTPSSASAAASAASSTAASTFAASSSLRPLRPPSASPAFSASLSASALCECFRLSAVYSGHSLYEFRDTLKRLARLVRGTLEREHAAQDTAALPRADLATWNALVTEDWLTLLDRIDAEGL